MTLQVTKVSGPVKDRLRALMFAQGIGSARLAAMTHISVRLICKYKAGASEPRDYFGNPTPNAYKLARALGVDVAELVPPRDREDAAA